MSVYVGIDVHRKRSQVAAVTEDGTVELNKNVVNGSEPMLRLTGGLSAMTASPPARPSRSSAFAAQIAHEGTPAPIQAGRRWPVERTHSWMNGYGKLRRMTDRDATIVTFYFYLAAAFVTVRALIQRARHRYRWDTRPTTKRLK